MAGLAGARARHQLSALLIATAALTLAVLVVTALVAFATTTVDAGVRAVAAEAPPTQRAAQVSVQRGADEEVAAAVERELTDAVTPSGAPKAPVYRSVASGTLDIAGRDDVRLVAVGYQNLAEHAELIEGQWPAGAAPSAQGSLPVALHAGAADVAGLSVGDVLTLDESLVVSVTALYVPLDEADPYFFGSPLETTGIEREAVLGPLVVDAEVLADRIPSITTRWRAAVDTGAMDAERLSVVGRRVARLEQVLLEDPALAVTRPEVVSALPDLVGTVQARVLSARSSMAVPLALLAVLATILVLLCGRLLRERRAVETSLLRARGSTRRQVVLWSLLETVAIAATAVLLGAPAGVLAARTASRLTPGAQAGALSLDGTAWAAAAAVAAAGAVILVAAVASWAPVTDRTGQTRGRRSGVLRGGFDLALVVAAAVALWQANQYRSAVVGAAAGGATVDPVMVAAPVLALLAGTALTLRLLPPGVRMAERVVTRSPGLTAPLAAWGLGRRAGTASVTALACVLTVGTAVLSLVFAASWGQLQGNRADGRVGADVRVVVTGDTPSQREVAPDGLASTYAALPGVQAVAPALRTSLRAGDAEAQVLAVDTRSARAAMTLPPETSGALASLGVPLAAPALDLPPGETLSATVEVVDGPSPDVIEAFIADIPPEFLEGDETLDPEEEARDFLRSTATFSVDLLLRDDDGLIRAVPLGRSTARDGPRTFTARLPAAGPGRGYVLAGVEARFSTGVGGSTYNPSLVLGQLTVGAEPVDLDAEWTALEGGRTRDQSVAVGVGAETGEVVLDVPAQPARIVVLVPGVLEAEPLPAVLNAELAGDFGVGVGDELDATLVTTDVTLLVTAVVDAVPTIDGPGAIVDLASLSAADLAAGEVVDRLPHEWFLATEGKSADVAAAVAGSGFDVDVLDRDAIAQGLRSDPLGAGPQGALALGAVAALAIAAAAALLGRTVAAPERRAEGAVLLALGVSARQLSTAGRAEQAVLALVATVVGAGLGVGVAALLVPALVGGAVAVPWLAVAAVALGVGAVLLALTTRQAVRSGRALSVVLREAAGT